MLPNAKRQRFFCSGDPTSVKKPWLIDLMAISHFISEIPGKSLRKTEFLPL
jgi:hypothetical protein